jgi:hypothetical protein
MPARVTTEALTSAYIKAKRSVLACGFGHEIVWQRRVRPDELTESTLLRECAWVILSCGMRESVIRRKFADVTRAFLDWTSAGLINSNRDECIRSALQHFRNGSKIRAIAETADIVHAKGFKAIRDEIALDPIGALKQFPFIGPRTSYHVAKNIGLSVVKPDRHLCRLAALTGHQNPLDLCQEIAQYIGEPVSVVDIVLWRFAASNPDYLEAFLFAPKRMAH